jgi:nucleoid DNA-binding protein
MAIYYKTLKFGSLIAPGNGTQNEKPIVVINSTIVPAEFIKRFTKTTKFSEADTTYFVYALKEFLINELKDGNIIQTGVLGTFYPEVKLQKKTSGNKATRKIAEPGIRYQPSKEIKQEMRLAEVKRGK